MSQSSSPPWDIVVAGAGAAGLLAATRAAECGRRTLLVEKNRRPGVKILISGGTRCNLTHATDNRGIVEAYGPQGRFLHSALAALSVDDTLDMFHAEGLETKVELPTGKIFPASDRATDVLAALLQRLERSGCAQLFGESVMQLERASDGFRLVTATQTIDTRKVIVTTGGVSYPGCGTTGDGYPWMAALGHTIVPPRPALVPITVEAPWVRELKGITIADVELRVVTVDAQGQLIGKQPLAQRRGSLLFAHFGLTGPVALDVSRVVSGHPAPRMLRLECDFLPHLTAAAVEQQLRAACAVAGKKGLIAVLCEAFEATLPRRLIESALTAEQITADRKAAEVSQLDRARVVAAMKKLWLPVSGTMGFKKAEVTAGGVALDEVDSRTMQSKLVPGLYLAGELLDLDGPIGGYNFQAAWSTGALAGLSASEM